MKQTYISIFDRPVDEEKAHAMAFWHKEWSKEKFVLGLMKGDRGWLEPALEKLPPLMVAGLLGRKNMIQAWPNARALAVKYKIDTDKLSQWDSLWSLAKFGVMGFHPSQDLVALTKREQDFLGVVGKHPLITTYKISKLLKMPYCRALEHKRKLLSKGLISQKKVKTGERVGFELRITREFLEPAHNSRGLPRTIQNPSPA